MDNLSLFEEILKMVAGFFAICLTLSGIIGLPIILADGINGQIPLWIGIASYLVTAILVCAILGYLKYRQQKWLLIPYEERKRIVYSRIK